MKKNYCVMIDLLMTFALLVATGCAKDDVPSNPASSSGDAETVTIVGTSGEYELSSLRQGGILYADRSYTVTRNLPDKFTTWQAAITDIRSKPGGAMVPSTSGKVYVMTRTNRADQMLQAGWQAETPYGESDDSCIFDSSDSRLVIWSKQATAGARTVIPSSDDNYIGGFIPIAPRIVLPESELVSVRGSLVDVREAVPGGQTYPQNENFVFGTELPSAVAGLQYATSLKELTGVRSVSCNMKTRIYAAVAGDVDRKSGWSKNGSLTVGETKYTLAVYDYDTSDGWVDVPAGDGSASTLVFGRKVRVDNPLPAPGTVIDKVVTLRKDKITDVNIVILPDGSYLASCYGALGGNGSAMYRSDDRGVTWKVVHGNDSEYVGFDKLFLVDGTLYQLGVRLNVDSDIIIRKSTDNAVTWTPFVSILSNEVYLKAPTPVVIHDGRVWHAVGGAPSGRKRSAIMISAPVGSDLLNPANWTESNRITFDTSWFDSSYDGSFVNWQEGNAVVQPDGSMGIVMRVDESNFVKPYRDCGALLSMTDEKTLAFNPETDFFPMAGGGKKFTINYDEVSGKYWAITNPCFDEDVNKTHEGIYSKGLGAGLLRNRLALVSSTDLRTWNVEALLVSSNNPFFHGFQYVDWVFEGDDIIAVCRCAFEEERGLPERQHDANMLVFFRWENFRNPDGIETIVYNTEGLKQ